MGEILATHQYTNKAKELIEDIIKSLDHTCEVFELTDDERSKLLNKFMLDLLIPNLKDIYLNSLHYALWGDEPYDRFNRKRTDYSSINRKTNQREYVGSENLDKLIFSTKDEAELVVTKLDDYVSQYGYVTVGYLFELMGEFCPYTAEYYGWTDDLTDRYAIVPHRKGYRLILPNPIRLEIDL